MLGCPRAAIKKDAARHTVPASQTKGTFHSRKIFAKLIKLHQNFPKVSNFLLLLNRVEVL